MQHPGWAPPDSDLLAYLMNDLEGARAEYVAIHLQHCADCRARLDDLRETLGLLQTLTISGQDDDRHRAAVKARIAAAAERDTAPVRSGSWRLASTGVALAVVLVLAVVTGPLIARAGVVSLSDIARIVPVLGDRGEAPQVIPVDLGGPPGERLGLPDDPTIEPAALAFIPLAPPTLPGDNRLTASVATADGRFHAIYTGSDNVELLVTQQPVTNASMASEEAGAAEQINGLDVLIYSSPADGNVIRMAWIQRGILFTVDAVSTVPDAFALPEARALAGELISLQDR